MTDKKIREFEPGDQLDVVLLVKEASVSLTKSGKDFLRIKLADSSGEIDAIQWDAGAKDLDLYPQGGFSRVKATAESFKGKVNLKIQKCRPALDTEFDPADFLPSSGRDLSAVKKELKSLVKSVKNPHLSKILKAFFGNKDFSNRFCVAPGATTVHHACVGGLMEHAVDMARTADVVATAEPTLNRDLLVTGALLHDIGKMDELSSGAGFDRTVAGNLVGHIVLGTIELNKVIEECGDIPEELRLELIHMLLSHHGTHEYGSPVLPATAEAFALHHIDNLNAKVRQVEEKLDGPFTEGAKFTDYVRTLGVRLFRRDAE